MIPLRRRPRELGLPDITPLLDVVFILLIFFVIAAAFSVHGVDMRLPQSSAARTYAGRTVEIAIAADGSLRADGEPITLRDLGFIVRRNASGETGAPRQILIKADGEAAVGVFLRAIDTIRDNGGDRLVIAAQPKPREGGGP